MRLRACMAVCLFVHRLLLSLFFVDGVVAAVGVVVAGVCFGVVSVVDVRRPCVVVDVAVVVGVGGMAVVVVAVVAVVCCRQCCRRCRWRYCVLCFDIVVVGDVVAVVDGVV